MSSKPSRRKFRQETVIHSYVTRPLSLEIIRLIWNTKITPNQITSFRILLNVLALGLFLRATFSSILVGFIFFHVHELLDSVDGMYARLKGLTSKKGGFMEILFDTIFSSSYGLLGFSITCAGYFVSGNTVYVFLFVALAMGSVFTHSFSKTFGSKEKKDAYEYLPILSDGIMESLKNIVLTVYIWENEFLLLGLLLYIPLTKFGIDSLLLSLSIVAALNHLAWGYMAIQYYKKEIGNE